VSRVGSLRLSGGRFAGRRLSVPVGVRPTEGRVREALFSIWQPHLDGSTFLDLFAGSGAVGIEALSRGASAVVGIEGDPRIAAGLRRTIERLDVPGRYRLVNRPWPVALGQLGDASFDLVFADHPYNFGAYNELVASVVPRLTPNGVVVIEHSARSELRVEGIPVLDRRRYGASALTFFGPSA